MFRRCQLFIRGPVFGRRYSQSNETIGSLLADRVRKVIETDFHHYADRVNVTVTSIPNPIYGDYQCNVAMPLAIFTKNKPVVLAEQIMRKLNVDDLTSSVEVAGQGFINFR